MRSTMMVPSMLVVGMALVFFCPQGDDALSLHPFLMASLSQLIWILCLFLLAIWGGWEIRQQVDKNHYKTDLNNLMREDDNTLLALQRKTHAFHELKKRSLALKKSLILKKDHLARAKRESSRLDIEIEHIGDSNLALVDKIQSVDRAIGDALEQLGMIKEVRMAFLNNIEQVNHYEHEIKTLLDRMVADEQTLPIVKRRKEMLQKEIARLEQHLASQEERLLTLQLETELSKEQYRVKKFALIREIEAKEEQEEKYKKSRTLIEKGRNTSTFDGGILAWMDHWGSKITQLWMRKGESKGV